jgi:aspartate racemase
LTTRYRTRSPDGSYPSILIDSIDAQAFFPLLVAGDRAGITATMLVELGRLARAGADVGLFASNSPHLVFDDVARESPIPLISIVEETARVAEAQGLERLGLLGARFTMEGGFYPDVFARRGMTVVAPDAEDRSYVHDRYFAELVEGSFLDETRAGILAVIDRMRAKDGIDAVILGGTELPLLFGDHLPATNEPMLDTTTIHVDSAIDGLLS